MVQFLRPAIAGAAIIGAIVAASAATAATADGLRAALALAPASPDPPRKSAIDFTDLSVAAFLTGKRGLDAVFALVRRLALPTHGERIGLSEAWPVKAGFALDDVDALATAGDAPNSVFFFRLRPAVTLDQLKKVWTVRGFAETVVDGLTLWARGKPRTFDLEKSDAEDPFGGTIGRASVLLPALPFVAESFAAESLTAAAAASVQGGLAARGDAAAVLAALDRNGGRLLQALLVAEPAATLGTPGGIAPYSTLLLADVAKDGSDEALILLSYADCPTATAAETEIKRRWSRQPPEVAALVPVWRTQQESGACVLAGTIAGAGELAARGIFAYRVLLSGLFARHLSALEVRDPR